ncbi:hypothetical protein, conserved [Plasmodium gonderi]|uniref:RING-type domain-containing protein n=1 Tax=Plasmodium gonderi TaxID=77519 RepID=A0A1Y1JKZ2_PLAGO|nr:hypothetical protein, conserved [Plasmodium gonderi]GAW82125.1 hypothetical protein, conserved [Plasmodium gonderi]
MKNRDNSYKKYKHQAEAKLEEFKKEAYEIIEYKDKIIKMLCAILEVQGITTLNIKKFISGPIDQKEEAPVENSEYEIKSHKRRISSKKRRLIKIPYLRTPKKKKELNLFSAPNKINEELSNEKNSSDSSLSSDRVSLKDKHLENHTMENMIEREFSGKKTDIGEENFSSDSDKESSNKDSTQTLDDYRNNDTNVESTCQSNFNKDTQVTKSKITPEMSDTITGECPLCLMPKTESLHGNMPPTFYKLTCDHVFHLMCIYETVVRRECRKTCCICHSEISEDDKNEIISMARREKKENEKKNKLMLKVMKLQADSRAPNEK